MSQGGTRLNRQETTPAGLAWVYGAHGLIHANMITFPTVLALVREDFGESWFVLGALATGSSMTFGLLGLPAGYLTDHIGARRVVLLSLAGSAAACLLAGLTGNLVMLGLALVLLGAFGGFYHPSALTLITTSLQRSGKALGRHGMGGNVGMAVAPLALASFASAAGWQAAFLAMGAAGAAYAAAAARGLPHPPEQEHFEPVELREFSAPNEASPPAATGRANRARNALANPVVVPLLLAYVIIFTMGFVYNGFVAFLPAYLTERAPASIAGVIAGGALTTLVLLLGMGGQWWGGQMAHVGKVRPAFLGAAMVVAAAGVAMWQLTGWALVVAAGFLSVLLFSSQPMGNTLLAELTSPRRRGLAFGVSFTLSFGVGSLSTVAMGYLADHGGLSRVFLALGAAALPAIIAAVLLLLRSRPASDEGQALEATGAPEAPGKNSGMEVQP